MFIFRTLLLTFIVYTVHSTKLLKASKQIKAVIASISLVGTSLVGGRGGSNKPSTSNLASMATATSAIPGCNWSTDGSGTRFLSTSTDFSKLSKSKSSSPLSSFVRDAVLTVGPSVVRIDCDREIPAFMTMFNDNFRDTDTVKVSGSGIVVSNDGYILTNAHVVEQARKVSITLSSGRSFKAQVIAFDELTDLAVLKASAGDERLQKAPIGNSASLHSGDWVVAVGCPVGLDFTVTLGIVSSPKRSAYEVGAVHLKGTYIQTDAALNSGNSGGPLVNDVGEVVGINTMVRSNTEAIGFAIPINRAMSIFEVLKQGKKPTHAYFGLEVMSLTPDFARIHNDDPNVQQLPEVHGALVLRVAPGSPAAVSGIRRNDIIIEVNGHAVGNSDDADVNLDSCKPGITTKLVVIRGDKSSRIEVLAVPKDLLATIEDRKRRLQVGQVSPPQPPGQHSSSK